MCLLYVFSIMVALFNAVATLVNNFVFPYGYSDTQAGIMGVLFEVLCSL